MGNMSDDTALIEGVKKYAGNKGVIDALLSRYAGALTTSTIARIKDNTIESRLLNERGLPNFNVRFFILNKAGDYAGVAMYGSGEGAFAVCDENGAREEPLEGLLGGSASG